MAKLGDRELSCVDLYRIKQAMEIHRSVLEASKPNDDERRVIQHLDVLICAVDDESDKRSRRDGN